MRSKEDETPEPIPRAPAHAGGVGSGWAKAPRVCLGEARHPLQWRGAVGRGRRRVASPTLQASARERDQGKPNPGLDPRLGVLPRRATQGFGGQKGEIWAQNRLIPGNGGRE